MFLYDVAVNNDRLSKQHFPSGLCNGDTVCLLCGTNFIRVYELQCHGSGVVFLGPGANAELILKLHVARSQASAAVYLISVVF